MNQTLMPTTSRAAMKAKLTAALQRPRPLLRHSLIALCLSIPVMATAATLTRTSAFVYDATGMLTKEIIEPDNSALCLVTEYSYDNYGNKHSATTRNCNGSASEAAAPSGDPVIASSTTTDTYDAGGQFPTTSNNALSQSESKIFDPKFGSLLSLTGPNGLTTTWNYDNLGRRILETRADGTQTKWDYFYCAGVNNGTASCPTVGGAAGAWLVQATLLAADGVTQIGPIKKTYYDSLNRKIRSETQGFDGTGTSTAIYKDTQYDSLGRAYKVSRPYYDNQTIYWTTATYDAIGRIVQETQADGTSTSTQYNGLTVIGTNAKSQTRTIVKNPQGQTISVTDTQNKTVSYTYDPFGNLTQTQDAVGNLTVLSYDLRGRKIQMIDPDMGTWNYVYNALGELIRQVDAKGQTSTLAYDTLGRITNRSETDLISNWYFDTYKGGGACNKGIGKLCQAETSTGYNRTHVYDNLGRASSTTTTLDTTYTVSVTYDATGRVATQSYPSSLIAKYVYTTLGYLKEVRNNTSNALYWQANNFDAKGHLLQQTYGNNIVAQQTWNAANGRLSGILAGAGNGVQNFTYQYDNLGNITSRTDANQSLTETFLYDSINRLTNSTVNSSGAGIVTKSYAYDAIGNMTSRSDLGNYIYNPSGGGSVRPHALTQINLSAGGKRTYAYDANGNLSTETQYDAANNIITTKGRAEYYTSFNMPISMGSPGLSLAFYYGSEHQRIKQISSSQGTTYYLNPGNNGNLRYEKDIKPDNSIEERNYITAYGQVVAMVKRINGSTWSTRYLHRDNLGSLTAITDEAGAVVERLAYEPFGKRRFATGSDDANNTILPLNTDRGFTNHEHLDELTLVHMNGRIYDPVVGRFMSPDPFIQDASSLQSYNRYSYVWNNPLGGVDPSGYFNLGKYIRANIRAHAFPSPKNVFEMIRYQPNQVKFDNWITDPNHKWAYGIAKVVVYAYGDVYGVMALDGYYAYWGSDGSVNEAVKAAAITYVTSSAFSYVNANTSGVSNVVANGVVGGASAEAQGGSFEKGFWYSAVPAASGQIYDSMVQGRRGKFECSNGEWREKGENIDSNVENSECPTCSDTGVKTLPGETPIPFISEASPGMRFLSQNIPGVQGFSTFHDFWMKGVGKGFFSKVYLVWTIPVAVAITYTAGMQGLVSVDMAK